MGLSESFRFLHWYLVMNSIYFSGQQAMYFNNIANQVHNDDILFLITPSKVLKNVRKHGLENDLMKET